MQDPEHTDPQHDHADGHGPHAGDAAPRDDEAPNGGPAEGAENAAAPFEHAPAVVRSTGDPEHIRGFALDCARLLHEDKCENIVVLDVRGRSQVSDYVVVGSGTSDRQMNSAIDDAVELGRERGFHAMRTNRDDRSTWLLADFVDVVAHLFEPNTRLYYDIETLWGDAPRVEWRDQRHRTAPNGTRGGRP